MKKHPIIRIATKTDLAMIIELLQTNELPTEDIHSETQHFFVLESDNSIIACCAVELYPPDGLLRSFAVRKEFQNMGYGKLIYDFTIKQSKQDLKLSTLYILTTTANNYFHKQNWKLINRIDTPKTIQASEEFASICPVSAVCMSLELK